MCTSYKNVYFLSIVLKDWNLCFLYATSLSRGLVMESDSFFSSVLTSCVVMELTTKKFGKDLRLINIYGTYGDRKPYWDSFVDYGILEGDNVIIGVI